MDLRLFGSPVARIGAEERSLPPGRPTRLLTALALEPGRVLDRDSLVTAVWDDDPPVSLRNALHVYVSRLRSLLGATAITTAGSGYRLTLPDFTIDAVRFQQLLDGAASALAGGSDTRAESLLAEAIDLHRAPLLAGEQLSPVLAAARARLGALHDQARETLLAIRLRNATRIEAGLLASIAQELVDEDPSRESRHLLLIESLQASGRTAEASAALERAVVLLERLPGPGLSAQFQALRSRVRAGGLSVSIASSPEPLVGREPQVEAVAALLRDRRLVSICGPGGIGKSRIAAEVVARTSALFRDRVARVDLEQASHPLVDFIARGLGIAADRGDPRDALLATLGDGPTMLLLDTCDRCDHAALADLIGSLTERLPELHVLCVGRRPIGAAGETVVRVPALDAGDDETSEQDLLHAPAVRLYLERAADAGHPVDPGLVSEVGHLTRLLDGSPLAIGLAAGHADGARPDLLLTRPLLDVVTSTVRGGAARHQSVVDSLEWTLELLSHDATAVLRTACYLPSGMPDQLLLAASGAVDPSRGFDELLQWSVLGRPASRVQATTVPHLVRAAVSARTGTDEVVQIRRRTREALADLSEHLLDRPLSVPRSAESSEVLFRLGEAAVQAQEWPDHWPDARSRALCLLLLVDAPFNRSQQADYARWIAAALEGRLEPDLRYDLERARIGVALACSNPDEMAAATEHMRSLIDVVDDRRRACWAVDLVFLALEEGRFDEAVDLAYAARDAVQDAGQTEGPLGIRAGRALMHAAHLHLGLEAGVSEALQTSALADLVDSTESISAFGEAAEILVNAGELELGRRYTNRAARLALRWNSPHSLVYVLSLADIALEESRLEESRAIVHALLDRVWRRGNDRYMKWCLIRLAKISELADDAKKAATLLGASSTISLTVGWDADPDVCDLLERLPAALGGEAFRYAFERGSSAPRGWVAALLDEPLTLPESLHPDIQALLRPSAPPG